MLLGASRPSELERLAADPRVRRPGRRRRGGPATATSASRPLVPAVGPRAGRGGVPAGDRLLQRPSSASPRCCRSTPAAWASSPATTSRPPPTSACRSSGVGLFYKTGYFRQSLNRDGWQQETTRCSTPTGCRCRCCARPTARPCVVTLDLPGGRELHAHVWRAQVGRVPLLLLDSDVQENDDAGRSVTDRLYGGGGEQRLQQEMLLGIGGVRALRLLVAAHRRPAPDVYHTNEGHAGFLGVERIRELARAESMTFDEALEAVRAATVFTTHTPVPAGIDRFDADAHRAATSAAPGPSTGVPVERLLAARRRDLRGRRAGRVQHGRHGPAPRRQRANGVSQLHGVVSREMFDGLWPGFDDDEVPITSITNGVHGPTWVDRKVFELAGNHAGVHDLDTQEAWDGIARPSRRCSLGDQARDAPAARRGGPAPRAPVVARSAAPAGRARLGRRDPRPRRAHHRLRPAGADLQAAHPDAARPRAAQEAAAATRAARCSSSSPASRTRPTRPASS